MTNSKQSNKRVVTRFTALFICMILVCGIVLPFAVFAYAYPLLDYNNNNIINLTQDGYYNLYGSSDRIYEMYSVRTYFDDVYCAIWDTPTQSYVICPVTDIYGTTWRVNSPLGGYNAYGYSIRASTEYSSNVYVRNNNSGVTLYYQDTQGNTTTHAPKYFYIKSTATCDRSGRLFVKTTGDWYQSGYTLTFDSQGGSSISSLTGVSGIVHLGESGQYYPQYVPTRDYYVFQGWSLTQNGTLVWDVDVQADTTLYAVWTTNPNNCQILTDNHNGWVSYYRNTDMTTPLPPIVAAGENVILPVYVDISNAPSNQVFTGINVEYNGVTTFYPNDNVQHYFQINVYQAGYLQIYSVFEEVREFQIAFNPSGDGNNTMQFATYENYYPPGTNVHLSGSYSFPMFITNIRLVGDSTHRIYGYPLMFDEWDEQLDGFYFTIDFTMPDENCTLTIFWSEMAGAHVQPAVSYDESGEAYFIGVSEEPFWNQDFSSAKDLIPQDFVGVVEYFGNLQVLSLVITIIMVAGFTAYLLRRQ